MAGEVSTSTSTKKKSNHYNHLTIWYIFKFKQHLCTSLDPYILLQCALAPLLGYEPFSWPFPDLFGTCSVQGKLGSPGCPGHEAQETQGIRGHLHLQHASVVLFLNGE